MMWVGDGAHGRPVDVVGDLTGARAKDGFMVPIEVGQNAILSTNSCITFSLFWKTASVLAASPCGAHSRPYRAPSWLAR